MKPLSLIKSTVKSIINYGSDARRFIKYSQMGKTRLNNEQLDARILATSHVIEKGLSLRDPRTSFGKKKILSLLSLMNEYCERGLDTKKHTYLNALGVLGAYEAYHKDKSQDVPDWFFKPPVQGEVPDILSGLISFNKMNYISPASQNFSSCISSRYSLRQFSKEPVNKTRVLAAIESAQKTPSVCNRQSWRLFWAQSDQAKQIVRELQSGNKGFGELADSFIIIATDLSTFFGIEERNQSFIDGGMFTMSLLLALHHNGVGTCPLNWSTEVHTDRKLRCQLKIPESMNIVSVIAIGSIPDTFTVAKSNRKPLDELMFYL